MMVNIYLPISNFGCHLKSLGPRNELTIGVPLRGKDHLFQMRFGYVLCGFGSIVVAMLG
jgi:hypothetical protein